MRHERLTNSKTCSEEDTLQIESPLVIYKLHPGD